MTALVCSALHVDNATAGYSKTTRGFHAVVPESRVLQDRLWYLPGRTCEFPFADAPVASLSSFHIKPTAVKNVCLFMWEGTFSSPGEDHHINPTNQK